MRLPRRGRAPAGLRRLGARGSRGGSGGVIKGGGHGLGKGATGGGRARAGLGRRRVSWSGTTRAARLGRRLGFGPVGALGIFLMNSAKPRKIIEK